MPSGDQFHTPSKSAANSPDKHITNKTKQEVFIAVTKLRQGQGLPEEAERLGVLSKAELIDEYYTLKSTATTPRRPTMDDSILEALQRQANDTNRRMDAVLEQMVEDRRTNERCIAALIEKIGATRGGTEATTRDTEEAPAPRAPRAPNPTVQAPKQLEEDVSLSAFETWVKTWNDYCSVTEADKYSQARQLGLFRGFLSPDMRNTLQHILGITQDSKALPEEVIGLLRKHIREERNIIRDLVAFDVRKQRQDETFNSFLVALKQVAQDAGIDDCQKCYTRQLITRIVSGIRDSEVQKKLLALRPFPELNKVIEVCKAEETAAKDRAALSTSRSANHATRGRSQSRDRSKQGNQRNTGGTDKKCFNCGQKCSRVGGGKNCPAEGKECHACKKPGHFSRYCRSKPGEGSSGGSRTRKANAVFRCLDVTAACNRRCPTVSICITGPSGESVDRAVTPDTGAELTLAPISLLEELDIDLENTDWPTEDDLIGPTGEPLETSGRLVVRLTHGDYTTEEEIHFCPRTSSFLLSWYACRDLGMIPEAFPAPMPKDVWSCSAVTARSQGDMVKTPNIHISDNPDAAEVKRVRQQILDAYKDVFTCEESLETMDGEPMEIMLKDDATPFALHAARQISLAHREAAKAELDNMVKTGVIKEVHHPTDWVHPLVVVPKPKGGVRLCVDLTKLNKHVKRPFYPMRTPRDVIASITPGCKFFTTLDATKGYWQIPLAEAAQDLTTFITPWGRYKFLRAVMGLNSSQDEYERRGNEAVGDIEDTYKIVDDILCANSGAKENLATVLRVLDRCRTHRITLSPGKFDFCQEEVKYVGYVLSPEGTKADPEKLAAIADFPTPTNLTELRSFFGLVNQLGDFVTGIAHAADPLRPLLKAKNVFKWEPVHDEAFKKTKVALLSPPVLVPFDPTLPTALQTDASRLKGLGFALLQQHGSTWKLVMCGSRFTTETESRYSMIELELLGVVWATRKCRLYLLGLPHYEVITDHKPLVPILNQYTLDMIETPRIQRLKEKLQLYSFTATWRKGKDHAIPDALSRAPVRDPEPTDTLEGTELTSVVRHQLNSITVSISDGETQDKTGDPLLEEVRSAATEDTEYQAVCKEVASDEKPRAIKEQGYLGVRDSLSVEDGLLLYGSRLVIPKKLRRTILERLHSSHQGIDRTLRRARQAVYWPGITSDVTNTVQSCPRCREHLPSNPAEPMCSETVPSRPFESASADLFSHAGKHYLVYADRLSGWPCIHSWREDPASAQVVSVLRQWFVDFGCPVRLRTDGGPQFAAKKFKEFCSRWGVHSVLSTPHYPQSNGHAEASVKAMKNLVAKSTEHGDISSDTFKTALLEWRNTPRAQGLSPAEILFGRQTRSSLPLHHSAYKKAWLEKGAELDQRLEGAQMASKLNYDKTAGRKLRSLPIGQEVLVQDHVSKRWNMSGIVIGIGRNRDYNVRMPSGRVLWRNRRFLRPVQGTSGNLEDDCRKPVETEDSTGSNKEVAVKEKRSKKTVKFEDMRRSDRLSGKPKVSYKF